MRKRVRCRMVEKQGEAYMPELIPLPPSLTKRRGCSVLPGRASQYAKDAPSLCKRGGRG